MHDQENRLIQIERKSDSRPVGEYQYDALSRRVRKIADPGSGPLNPVETRYIHDDARIVEEQNDGGVTLAAYTYGNYIDEVLTMERDSDADTVLETYWHHQNALWSVAALTDASANVVERYAYEAYGCVSVTNGFGLAVPVNAWRTPHSAFGNPWLFTGRQLDEEAGLYYYRARYMDCGKGRFVERDPLGYVDGMNLYEYARSNPTRWLDPAGQQAKKGASIPNQREAKSLLNEIRLKVKPDEKQLMKSLDDLQALISDPKTTDIALINLNEFLRARLADLKTRELNEKLAKIKAEIDKCRELTEKAREAVLKTLADVAKSGIIPEKIAMGEPIAPKPKK